MGRNTGIEKRGHEDISPVPYLSPLEHERDLCEGESTGNMLAVMAPVQPARRVKIHKMLSNLVYLHVVYFNLQ